MKIHPDQIEGVQPEQTQRKNKANAPGQAFGDLLNQEVAKGDAPAVQGVAPPPIVNPLINVQQTAKTQPSVDMAAAGQVESVLDKWDSYASTLAGPGGLKAASGTLDEIAEEVAAIRKDRPELDQGLKSIVDELETLAAAERFKFNRGDYN